MSNNVIELFTAYKTEVERQQFVEKQHETIGSLSRKLTEANDKITHLEQLLLSKPQEHSVEPMIVTPEEALIVSQISILQERSMQTELSLEEVKKLDVLLKWRDVYKKEKRTVPAAFKTLKAEDLIQLAQLPPKL